MRTFIIIVIAVCLWLVYTNYAALTEFQLETVEYQMNVGRYLVIDVDTFMVVDYNQIMGEYTLNNGLVVNRVLVEANKIEDPWEEYVAPVRVTVSE